MRRGALGVVTACGLGCAAALAGCGGAHQSGVTEVEAAAFAKAVNLRQADIQDAVPARSSRRYLSASLWGEQVDSCDGRLARTGEVAAIYSPRFRHEARRGTVYEHGMDLVLPPISGVSSEVLVARNTALARQDLAAAMHAVASGCVARLLADKLRRASALGQADRLTVRTLPSPVPGLAAYGLRISGVEFNGGGAGHRSGAASRAYEDTIGFVDGPAEVLLSAVGVGRSVGTDAERRLLALLHERAHALQPVFAGKQALIIE